MGASYHRVMNESRTMSIERTYLDLTNTVSFGSEPSAGS